MFNQVYVQTVNYVLGGAAATVILFLMFRKASAVAASGNRAKMIGWSLGAPAMVVVSVIAAGVAINVALPRLQAAINSQPVQGAAQLGNMVTAMADQILFGSGDGGYVSNPGGLQLQPPALMQEASNPVSQPAVVQPAPTRLVNGGQVASFVWQPANVAANAEVEVITINDAVTAFRAFDATATPTGQERADLFVVANNGGTYTVRSGDSLGKIAAKFGVSTAALCAANRNIISNCNVIRAGWVLAIPAPGSASVNSAANVVPTPIQPFGRQQANYYVQPTPAPVYVQPAQPAVALQRNLATGDTIINSNADAVQAIEALAPMSTIAPVVVAPTPTPRSVYTYAELKAQQGSTVPGGGQAYIDQFLKTYGNNTTVADASNDSP